MVGCEVSNNPGWGAHVKLLTVWSRSRFGEWVAEGSHPEARVRGLFCIPVGGGVLGRDGLYRIALPQGVMPSELVRHPEVASGMVAIPLVARRNAS